jgi:hypothetical protein
MQEKRRAVNYEPIPPPPSLENSIKSDIDTLTEILCEYYEHSNGRPLIDELYELRYPSMIEFTDLLNNALQVQTDEERTAIYQAFHFSLCSAKLLGWELRRPLDLYDYFAKFPSGTTTDTLHEAMLDDGQEYLAHKEVLNSLISSFMPEMTHLKRGEQLCETVAALTFMQIEKSVVLRTDEGMATSFAAQLDSWDGMLPDGWQS